mmetsp:Transcript_18143/g.42727  ORF Transcript_18143/g.42727 Transcript_18143/m.42727 type:complete len:222 (-) Transcript_18143:152-817(-)
MRPFLREQESPVVFLERTGGLHGPAQQSPRKAARQQRALLPLQSLQKAPLLPTTAHRNSPKHQRLWLTRLPMRPRSPRKSSSLGRRTISSSKSKSSPVTRDLSQFPTTLLFIQICWNTVVSILPTRTCVWTLWPPKPWRLCERNCRGSRPPVRHSLLTPSAPWPTGQRVRRKSSRHRALARLLRPFTAPPTTSPRTQWSRRKRISWPFPTRRRSPSSRVST